MIEQISQCNSAKNSLISSEPPDHPVRQHMVARLLVFSLGNAIHWTVSVLVLAHSDNSFQSMGNPPLHVARMTTELLLSEKEETVISISTMWCTYGCGCLYCFLF